MKKSIYVALAFIAVTSFTSQIFAQESAAKTTDWDIKKNVKCRVSTTETGCSIVFETNSPSPEGTSSKKGYDYYQVQSAFNVSATDNTVSEIVSPRDAASGLPTGKRMHKPMTVSSGIDETSTMAKSSGGGSGKVNVQDISLTKRCGGKTTKISCDGSDCIIPTGECPNGDCAITLDWSWGMSQSGSSKRCSVNFLLQIENGACMAINEKGLPGKSSSKK